MFISVTNENKMPDSSSSPSTAVISAPTMSDKSSNVESSKRNDDVHIDLGEVTPHNIKVLKKVNQVLLFRPLRFPPHL